jgi:NitT/TauT family transport system substrate-binding protein
MSRHSMTRRDALRMIGGASLLAGAGFARAGSAPEAVSVINLGFVLGIHTPSTRGLAEECPRFGVQVEQQRLQRMRDVLQTIMGGTGDIGIGDPILLLSSRQAGHDIVMFGNYYLHTTLVLVVNSDVVQSWKDLEKPDVTLGVNGLGDITHVLILGALQKNGVDPKKVKWADVGGSGSRVRALIGKRVQGTVVHFDQIAEIQKSGNYRVLLVPHKEYNPWVNEIVFARGEWLRSAANRRKAVAVMKGIVVSNRRATADYQYFKDAYMKYSTNKGREQTPDQELRDYWKTVAQDIGVWPADNGLSVASVERLLPFYRAAEAISDKPVDVARAIDTTIVAQALKELG